MGQLEPIPITTFSSREVNQDLGRAKKAGLHGLVITTDRGKPAHVLLSIEEYRWLTGRPRSLVDALSMPGLSEIEFEPPRADIQSRVPDLS